ncbi:hypothetical protein [Nocardioides koreensis]
MNKRGTYGSMADRVARSSQPEAAEAAEAVAAVPVKHCWVTGAEGRVPGLLLEWRKRPDGWHARVVRPVRDHAGDWVVVEEWLPAGLLDPLG